MTRTLLRPASHATPIEFCFDPQGQRIVMRLDLAEFASNDLYCLDRQFEAATLDLWAGLAVKAGVVVDWGSHVGTFSLVAAAANRRARILAVEACLKNLPYLRNNAAQYPNIEVWATAIARTSGKHLFYEEVASGGGILVDSGAEGRRHATSNRGMGPGHYEVDAFSPSDFCVASGVTSIDLMKIDLEGLEYELLCGCDDFWGSFAPKHLIVEVREDSVGSKPANQLFNAMRSRGYAYQHVESLLTLHRIRRRRLDNWHFWLAK